MRSLGGEQGCWGAVVLYETESTPHAPAEAQVLEKQVVIGDKKYTSCVIGKVERLVG